VDSFYFFSVAGAGFLCNILIYAAAVLTLPFLTTGIIHLSLSSAENKLLKKEGNVLLFIVDRHKTEIARAFRWQ
jgi:hypothetical protein